MNFVHCAYFCFMWIGLGFTEISGINQDKKQATTMIVVTIKFLSAPQWRYRLIRLLWCNWSHLLTWVQSCSVLFILPKLHTSIWNDRKRVHVRLINRTAELVNAFNTFAWGAHFFNGSAAASSGPPEPGGDSTVPLMPHPDIAGQWRG